MRSMIALLGLATVVLSGCAVHSHDRHSYHYPQRAQGHPVIIQSAPVRHYAPPARPVVIKQAPRQVIVRPAHRVAPVVHMAPKPVPKFRPAPPLAAPKQPPRHDRQVSRTAQQHHSAPPRQARTDQQPRARQPAAQRPHGQQSPRDAHRRH